ncbi:MAG: tripartite tricarboxylate transporter TctB family protein [Lachnospiraceae bacterium]|nr:tripartite tricarboxylate transporter TctB family protein [Lachnospiraceae bacterium]
MTMRWKERLAAIGCFGLFLFAFINSRSFPEVPKILPTAVTVIGMALAVGLFVRTFIMKYEDDGKKMDADHKAGAIKVGLAIVMLVAYILLLSVVGFFVTSFIFMMVFAYVIDNEKRKLWLYPVVSAGLLLVVWGIFGLFLKVPLPKGILF